MNEGKYGILSITYSSIIYSKIKSKSEAIKKRAPNLSHTTLKWCSPQETLET